MSGSRSNTTKYTRKPGTMNKNHRNTETLRQYKQTCKTLCGGISTAKTKNILTIFKEIKKKLQGTGDFKK